MLVEQTMEKHVAMKLKGMAKKTAPRTSRRSARSCWARSGTASTSRNARQGSRIGSSAISDAAGRVEVRTIR